MVFHSIPQNFTVLVGFTPWSPAFSSWFWVWGISSPSFLVETNIFPRHVPPGQPRCPSAWLPWRGGVWTHRWWFQQGFHHEHWLRYFSIWLWINTYENTIFNGMNIHKSQLFWCELQGYQGFDTLPYQSQSLEGPPIICNTPHLRCCHNWILLILELCIHTHMLHCAGIFTYIWVIFRVNVGKYSIHGAYGYVCSRSWKNFAGKLGSNQKCHQSR